MSEFTVWNRKEDKGEYLGEIQKGTPIFPSRIAIRNEDDGEVCYYGIVNDKEER